jgi:hypothetical protein
MSVEDDIREVAAAWDAALVRNDAELVASFMIDDWISEVFVRSADGWRCALSQKTDATAAT